MALSASDRPSAADMSESKGDFKSLGQPLLPASATPSCCEKTLSSLSEKVNWFASGYNKLNRYAVKISDVLTPSPAWAVINMYVIRDRIQQFMMGYPESDFDHKVLPSLNLVMTLTGLGVGIHFIWDVQKKRSERRSRPPYGPMPPYGLTLYKATIHGTRALSFSVLLMSKLFNEIQRLNPDKRYDLDDVPFYLIFFGPSTIIGCLAGGSVYFKLRPLSLRNLCKSDCQRGTWLILDTFSNIFTIGSLFATPLYHIISNPERVYEVAGAIGLMISLIQSWRASEEDNGLIQVASLTTSLIFALAELSFFPDNFFSFAQIFNLFVMLSLSLIPILNAIQLNHDDRSNDILADRTLARSSHAPKNPYAGDRTHRHFASRNALMPPPADNSSRKTSSASASVAMVVRSPQRPQTN